MITFAESNLKTKIMSESTVKVAKDAPVKKFIIPQKTTIVEIRPIEVKKWHDKTGQESFTRPKKIHALVDTGTMKYATGLSEAEVEALIKEKSVKYDLSDSFVRDVPHPFWDSTMATLALENVTMLLDISQPLNFIKARIAKASRFVANSLEEYENGEFPDATHIIYSEKHSEEVVATKVELKNEAILESSKLSPERKIQIILILGEKNAKNQSASFVTIELDKVITKDPESFLRLIKTDPKKMATHYLVLEALQQHVLRKDGPRILYMDDSLGSDVMDVVDYLNNDNNQDIKMIIMSKLNNL